MKTLVNPEQELATTTRSILQPIVQVAFNLAALYTFHNLHIYVWRAMTGH
jgi:hypothetical protein